MYLCLVALAGTINTLSEKRKNLSCFRRENFLSLFKFAMNLRPPVPLEAILKGADKMDLLPQKPARLPEVDMITGM